MLGSRLSKFKCKVDGCQYEGPLVKGLCDKHYCQERHRSSYTKKVKPNCKGCNCIIGHNNKYGLCSRCQYAINGRQEGREKYRRLMMRVGGREAFNSRRSLLYKSNLSFKLKAVLRARLNTAVKRNIKTGSAIKDLGCSIAEFKRYLESKFKLGMTWDNWGKGANCWHIDHVVPLSSFNLSDPEQFKKACHYTNLQPLWETDNLSKGNKIC